MTTSSSIRITRLTRDHWEGLSELHGAFFGIVRTPGFWNWKYEQRPHSDCRIAVALSGEKVIGQMGVVNYPAYVGGNDVMFYQIQDIVIAEPYRKGILFFQMQQFAKSNLGQSDAVLTYGFSIEITRQVATTSLGFKDVARIPKLVQVCSFQPIVEKTIRNPVLKRAFESAAHFLKPLLWLVNKRAHTRLPSGWHVRIVESFDDQFDDLWNRCKNEYPVSIVRDASYLRWRYQQNPVQPALSFKVTDAQGTLQGFIVVAVKEGTRGFKTLGFDASEGRRGEILDFLVAPSDGSDLILRALVRVAQDELLGQDVDVISCWALPHMPMYGLLRSLGFVERQTPHNLIVRIENEEAQQLKLALDADNWYLTLGDKDHF